MNASQMYVAIAIVALGIVAIVLYFIRGRKPERKLSKLGALSLFLVIAGIVFGENRLLGYGLMATGIILAVVDIIKKSHNKNIVL